MIETACSFSSRLYPQLLETSWHNLDQAIQIFHGEEKSTRAIGLFRVRHGNNSIARLLARLSQLPAAGESVAVQLLVSQQQGGEEWKRVFADQQLISFQSKRRDGLLAERIGALEIWFELKVIEGALVYHQRGAALCLWSLLCFSLPSWLSPRIFASETATVDGQVYVFVKASLPLLGLVIAYEGTITKLEG